MKLSPLNWAQNNVDKVAHASISFSLMIFMSLVLLDFPFGYLISFVLTMGIGVLKEIHDMHRPNGSGWSNADLVADFVGAALGFLAVVSLFGF